MFGRNANLKFYGWVFLKLAAVVDIYKKIYSLSKKLTWIAKKGNLYE